MLPFVDVPEPPQPPKGAPFYSSLWGEKGENWTFYDRLADISYAGYMGALGCGVAAHCCGSR